MATIIRDGTGSGYGAKVDANNRLGVASVSEDLLQNQLRLGLSHYISAGANDWFGGTYASNEYVMFEFYNNTEGDLLITSPEVWLSPAHTTGPYAETTDQYARFNQWISNTPYLDSSGTDGIKFNLNGPATNELDDRDNGNSAVRHAERADAVAIPAKTAAAGYYCGFLTSITGKSEMLPPGQGLVLGKGQSWIVSCKPVQNSSPTNHIIGVRASVIDLSGVEL